MKRLEGGELAYPNEGTCTKENPGSGPCEVSGAVNFRRKTRKWFVPLRGESCGCIQRRKNLHVPEKKSPLSSG